MPLFTLTAPPYMHPPPDPVVRVLRMDVNGDLSGTLLAPTPGNDTVAGAVRHLAGTTVGQGQHLAASGWDP